MKKRILIVSDGIGLSTGLSSQTTQIVKLLSQDNRFEVIVLSLLNYRKLGIIKEKISFDNKIKEYEISKGEDLYIVTLNLLSQYNVDYVFTILDLFKLTFLYKIRQVKNFYWLAYIPIDSNPFIEDIVVNIQKDLEIINVKEILEKIDLVVVYNDFGKKVIEDTGYSVDYIIPHGINVSDYYNENIDKEKLRKKYFNNKFDKNFIIFIFIGINQQRKRFDILLKAWSEFFKKEYKVLLYILTDKLDNIEGGQSKYDLRRLIDINKCQNFIISTKKLLKEDYIDLFRVSDVLINCSCSEGFGMPILEAKASQLATIQPNFVGCSIFKTGLKLESKSQINSMQSNLTQYIIDYKDLSNHIKKLYENRSLRIQLGKEGRKEALNYDWNIINEKWKEVFNNL